MTRVLAMMFDGALLHGAAMIKVVPSIDEDQAIG